MRPCLIILKGPKCQYTLYSSFSYKNIKNGSRISRMEFIFCILRFFTLTSTKIGGFFTINKNGTTGEWSRIPKKISARIYNTVGRLSNFPYGSINPLQQPMLGTRHVISKPVRYCNLKHPKLITPAPPKIILSIIIVSSF